VLLASAEDGWSVAVVPAALRVTVAGTFVPLPAALK
jgi:hypothetical protein